MKRRFLGQKPAVLRWLVEGAMEWYQDERLEQPEYAKQMKAEQKADADSVELWIRDLIDFGDPVAFMPNSQVMEAYEYYCKVEHIAMPAGSKRVYDTLEGHGVKKNQVRKDPRTGKSTCGLVGIRCKDTDY